MNEELGFGEFSFDVDDEEWNGAVQKPRIAEGEYSFIISDYEKVENEVKGSVSYKFTFKPYLDDLGMPVESTVSTMEIPYWFYIGNKSSGKLIESPFANIFKTFLRSIDVTPMKRPDLINPSTNTWMFTKDSVKGIVVKAKVVWEQRLSNRESPKTGLVPVVIDPNDPDTYFLSARLVNIRGQRDENGEVKKVFI